MRSGTFNRGNAPIHPWSGTFGSTLDAGLASTTEQTEEFPTVMTIWVGVVRDVFTEWRFL
jgi:hypothetical protein